MTSPRAKEVLRPRLVRRPSDPGMCWALISLTSGANLPCRRRARLGHQTCGTHHEWEHEAQEELALYTSYSGSEA
jgi:hypothetical protein